MPVNLTISGRVSPNTIEQGRNFTLFASFVNGGTDTACSAHALLVVPEGFHVLSPNPTLLGDIRPNDSGGCSFTVITSEDARPGNYGLILNIKCEERHWYWPVPKRYVYSINLTINVEESKKKMTARVFMQEVKTALDSLDSAIGDLEKAGGDVSTFRLEYERLSKAHCQSSDLFNTRAFEQVIDNCRKLLPEVRTLQSRCASVVEELRVESLGELTKAKEAVGKVTWATADALSKAKGCLDTANKYYSEKRYSDAAKLAQAAILSIPKTPLKVRLHNIWISLKQRKRYIGITFFALGFVGLIWLLILFLEGEVSFLFVLPPLISLLVGIGLSLSKT